MEAWEVIVEAGVAVVSGLVGAGGVLWTLGRKLQKIEDKADKALVEVKELRDSVQKLEREVDQDRRQGAEQWQDLNRTLGQIEGMMGGGPPRPRLPSNR
jgi:outer membrane murein-binding lipoprotein Lpp